MICCSRCLEILLGGKITWPVLKATPHSNSFRSQPLVSISTPLKCNGLPLTNDRWKIIPTFIMVGWKRKISHFRRYLQNVYLDFIFIIQNWFIYSSSLPCLLDLVGHPKKMAKFLSRWFLWRSTVVSAPIELDFFGKHLLTYQTWRRQAMYFEWVKRLTQNPCILVIAPGLIWDVTIIYNRNESSSPNLYDWILVLTKFSFPDFWSSTLSYLSKATEIIGHCIIEPPSKRQGQMPQGANQRIKGVPMKES